MNSSGGSNRVCVSVCIYSSGFATPFNVVVVSKDEPITDRAMLRRLDAFQEEIAGDARVKSVVGPGDHGPSAGNDGRVN